MTVADNFVAWVRTVVPTTVAALVAFAATHGLPDEVAGALADLGPFLVAVCVAGTYAVSRWLEKQPWVPNVVKVVLFGSTKQPSYEQPAD